MSRQEEDREVEMTVSSDWMKLVDERMNNVEQAVARVETNTAAVVEAFSAAQGAFKVLEWLGKAAKPILWIGGAGTVGAVLVSKVSATAFGRFFLEIWK